MIMMILALCFLSFLILPQLPWWFIAILSIFIGYNSKGVFQSIMAGFIFGFLPWIFILVYNYYNGAEIIIGRVSGIFFYGWINWCLYSNVTYRRNNWTIRIIEWIYF